ncbi:MAG: nitroreductase family protein [Candidatus Aminicenantes bacterium]|nr:nitroreductase family protein [Candidatus Aminicenantes bacterium]
MNRRTFLNTVPAITFLAGTISGGKKTIKTSSQETPNPAGDLQPIKLVKPETDGGKSVLASLKERRTIRSIDSKELPPQMLSNLLWAAFGVNRENEPHGGPGRTAASASNSQEIDLYVTMPQGVYLYDAAAHILKPVVAGDYRHRARRRRGSRAPVNIFFVVDIAKYSKAPFQEPGLKDTEIQKSYYYVATGLIAQNVYLYAASRGLAAHFHNCNKQDTHREFKLRPEQRVLFAQTIGFPAAQA